MNKRPLIITGIGTDIGKTLIAAIFVEALGADYWKPVQAGNLDQTDLMRVQSLVSNITSHFHQESFRLTAPVSPHAAAMLDNVTIDFNKMHPPKTANRLIVEGAGGLMVPLNNKDLMIDFISYIGAEVILVSKNYLGSINHTLLSAEALERRKIPVAGIVFNGESTPATEKLLLEFTKFNCLGRIPFLEEINKDVIKDLASKLDISKLI
jgi:dethiobiotin synthetase